MSGCVPNEITVQAPPDTQRRLIFFVTDFLNRGYRVRDAVSAGFKSLADSFGEGSELRVNEETFEKTCAYFEKAVETYRMQQEAGATAVGGGVYAEVVGEDEYRERVAKGQGV
jgi:hypothetical protein